MTTDEPDFDVQDFSDLLRTLPKHLPISDAFEVADPQKQGHWWTSQREHMSEWFAVQATTGEGSFTRNQGNRSARRTYQRLGHAEGLVWIAEALGADSNRVQAAVDAALAEPNRRRRPAIVRHHLPWSAISVLAARHLPRRS